jgi:hypothetical protein
LLGPPIGRAVVASVVVAVVADVVAYVVADVVAYVVADVVVAVVAAAPVLTHYLIHSLSLSLSGPATSDASRGCALRKFLSGQGNSLLHSFEAG